MHFLFGYPKLTFICLFLLPPLPSLYNEFHFNTFGRSWCKVQSCVFKSMYSSWKIQLSKKKMFFWFFVIQNWLILSSLAPIVAILVQWHSSYIRKGEVLSCYSYSYSYCCVCHAQGTPPWILKRGGVESSGRRLISSFVKTKRIAFFYFFCSAKKKIF